MNQTHCVYFLPHIQTISWKMITKEGRKPYVRMTMLMEDEITLEAISRNPKQFTGKLI